MPGINSRMYPEVYKSLGVDISNMGCIMLDVAPFEVVKLVHNGEADIYQHSDQKSHPHIGGVPVEDNAHCTLLYGLLEYGDTWKEEITQVLDGWTPPDLEVEEITAFPSIHEGEDYSVIVAKIRKTPELLEGHQRLSLLPHVNTFLEYEPHVTLAYIKNGPSSVSWAEDTKDKWIKTLTQWVSNRTLDVERINYGSDD